MKRAHQIAVVVALAALPTIAHYATDVHDGPAHDIYQRVYYLPVILAGLWFGARGGFERDIVETLSSEPKTTVIGNPAIRLEANRAWGGALLGIATGFNHVHVALEISAYYQVVSGSYNDTNVTVKGLTVQPATALWWTF